MQEKEAIALFYEARSLEKEHKYEEALQRYGEALALDDKLDKAWFYKFRLHHELGQFSEAAHCAQRATEINIEWRKFITRVQKKPELDTKAPPPVRPQELAQREDQDTWTPPVAKTKPAEWKEWKKERSLPADLAKSAAAMGFTEDFLIGIAGNLNTQIVQNGKALQISQSIVSCIGMATKAIDGKGPQEVKYQITGEEWNIERVGQQIIIHSYRAPREIDDPRLRTTYFAAVEHPYRLLLALDEAGKIDLKKLGEKLLTDHQGRVYWVDI
ncbi:MAG: hypothetical protein ACXADC_13410 [Candidatus Thorarchaeota archaeon]